MAWGLFKKIVIADRLAIVVDHVYGQPYQHRGLSFIIATIFFSFQIFCDFSGYSDMAIGMAKVMGFKLVKNFNKPYHAKNIKDFWSRWHISLSTWFRDYVYIPLGGNRVGYIKWRLNILTVFLISGLWHGANWTFAVWGLLHAIFFIADAALTKVGKSIKAAFTFFKSAKVYQPIRVVITFGMVTFAWIFFRAPSVKTAIHIVKSMFLDTLTDFSNLYHHLPSRLNLGLAGSELLIAVLSIVLLEVVHLLQAKASLSKRIKEQPTVLRWAIYFLFLFLLVTFSETHTRTFIYFQF
jgi:D-alanyl-lipoteichoic acid acyltransferase DltB (MBOAT superfamily)